MSDKLDTRNQHLLRYNLPFQFNYAPERWKLYPNSKYDGGLNRVYVEGIDAAWARRDEEQDQKNQERQLYWAERLKYIK